MGSAEGWQASHYSREESTGSGHEHDASNRAATRALQGQTGAARVRVEVERVRVLSTARPPQAPPRKLRARAGPEPRHRSRARGRV